MTFSRDVPSAPRPEPIQRHVKALPDARPKPKAANSAKKNRPAVSSLVPTVVGGSVESFQDAWVLPLPFDKPLSLNDRMNHWVKAKGVKEWRDATRWTARAARIPACERIQVGLHYIPRDNRRRDPDNLVAAMKPCVDALVDEGIVVDDTAQYVVREWPEIHLADPKLTARFWLTVVRLA